MSHPIRAQPILRTKPHRQRPHPHAEHYLHSNKNKQNKTKGVRNISLWLTVQECNPDSQTQPHIYTYASIFITTVEKSYNYLDHHKA